MVILYNLESFRSALAVVDRVFSAVRCELTPYACSSSPRNRRVELVDDSMYSDSLSSAYRLGLIFLVSKGHWPIFLLDLGKEYSSVAV